MVTGYERHRIEQSQWKENFVWNTCSNTCVGAGIEDLLNPCIDDVFLGPSIHDEMINVVVFLVGVKRENNLVQVEKIDNCDCERPLDEHQSMAMSQQNNGAIYINLWDSICGIY